MKTYPSWVHTYLNILGLPASSPSWTYLCDLCTAHLTHFPFENISKLLRYRAHDNGHPVASIETFLAQKMQLDFGGTCFALNGHLLRLLQALDFDAYHVNLSDKHMAIVVRLPELDGERVYVDCGAAAPVFTPIRFETHPDNVTRFGEDVIQIRPQSKDKYEYARYMNGQQSGDAWYFDATKPYSYESFDAIVRAANQPGTTFMSMLRCQLWQLNRQRSVSLANNLLSIRHASGEVSKHTLHSVNDIEDVLRDEFQLHQLPIRKAVEVLERFNVNIFAS